MNRNIKNHTFENVRPAKIQISLRICAVCSETSLNAFWIAKDAMFIRDDNEDSNHTARMRRLIWNFFGSTSQKVFCSPLRKHVYSNILKYHQKMKIFRQKKSDIFHISAQNTDCGYSLEPPGGSNEYPQSMFLSRYKKKVGFKGVKII